MTFDVPSWIATLVGCERNEVEFESETEADGYVSVVYTRAGRPVATIDLVAMPMSDARRASWQVFAQFDERIERVQVPANTRFTWR